MVSIKKVANENCSALVFSAEKSSTCVEFILVEIWWLGRQAKKMIDTSFALTSITAAAENSQ